MNLRDLGLVRLHFVRGDGGGLARNGRWHVVVLDNRRFLANRLRRLCDRTSFLLNHRVDDWRRDVRLLTPRLAPLAPFLGCTVADVLRWLRLEQDRAFVALLNLLLIITVQSEVA